MFKLGRGSGGGRGNGKRPVHPPPGRPVGSAPSRTASLPGGGRGRGRGRVRGRGRGAPPPDSSSSSSSGQGKEESFSMVSREALDFGAIIRLAPDLVDEIRRAEARGGPVRIKFDPFSNDPSGNVLEVDGKEFKFTWSRDSGDLCNIYEEGRNGEDGNGLLVERGSAWRKLNVQRILDESIKNHVKMRSEEAERRNKSRKAIVLDPANPSVKNQSSAAVEGSMRRMHWNKRKETLFKKQKVESSQGTFKQTLKTASSKHTSRNQHSVSPFSSPPEKPATDSLMPSFGVGNISKIFPTADAANSTAIIKEDAVNSEKELNNRGAFRASKKVVCNKNASNSQSTDLRTLLMKLLLENPKGMSLKALEKAVGETMPCSPKKIESVLKNIANFQAPGRYLLKPGVGVDGNVRLLSESGSSPDPENARERKAVPEHIEKATIEEFEPEVDVCSLDEEKPGSLDQIFEKTNEQQASPDAFTTDAKVDNDSEGRAGSSSDSGSDSDSESDSSDSGTDSGSQSRSPAGSGSASSSDSESDGSSSSKETDVEVNITTSDDEQDEMDNESLAAKLKSSTLTRTWSPNDEQHDQNGLFQNQRVDVVSSPHFPKRNFDVAQTVENAKDMPLNNNFISPENPEVEILEENIASVDSKSSLKQFDEGMPSLTMNQKHFANGQVDSYWALSETTYNQNVFPGREKPNGMKDILDREQSCIPERTPKFKTKRLPECNNVNEKAESTKKPKNMGYSLCVDQRKESSLSRSRMVSNKSEQNQFFDSAKLVTVNAMRGSIGANNLQESGPVVPERSNAFASIPKIGPSPDFQNSNVFDAQDSGRRSGDFSGKRKPFNMEKSGRRVDSLDSVAKHTERLSAYSDSDFSTLKNPPHKDNFSIGKDKHHQDSQDEILEFGEKSYSGSVRDGNLAGRLSFHESVYKKSIEQARNQKDDFMTFCTQKSDMDNMTSVCGKGSILKRELSDLELGEFREPTSTECSQGNRMSSERKGSFKTSENKVNSDDDFMPGYGKRMNTHESKKQSPISENRNRNSQEGLQRKMSEHSAKPQQRAATSQPQPCRRSEQADLDSRSHADRFLDPSQREESRGTLWRTPANSDLEEGSRPVTEHVQQKDPRHMADRIHQKDNDLREPVDKKNDVSKKDANSNAERMESSEDKATLFFLKFEKDEPDLRGPIKYYSQYREYVQEFEEKYQCYLSLNELMEKTRVEFFKIGGNFPELAKGKDKKAYNECCRRIIKFCRQNKMRDNRIKKTFIVLHEELKVLKQRIKDFAAEYS